MSYMRKPFKLKREHAFPKDGYRPRTIWITAAPKTGSTLLTMRLHHCLSWRAIWPLPRAFWRQPQQLRMTAEFGSYPGNVLIPQTHTMFNEASEHWMKKFDIHVVVPKRRLLDSLVSASEHSKTEAGLPFGYLPDSIKDMSDDERLSYVISVALGWYIQFYTGWHIASKSNEFKVIYVDYTHMVEKPTDNLRQLLSDLKVDRTDDEIKEAVEYASADKTRFNVGGDRSKECTAKHRALYSSMVKAAMANPDVASAVKALI